MDTDPVDGFFAAPPFKADEALLRLARELRELGLSGREGLFERRGVALARARVEADGLRVARVRRPARSSPEWIEKSVTSSAQLRDFVADLKKQLATWSDRDD